MNVGTELRRARTARRLSLAEISQRTKINQTLLRAIEENRFDRVPGGLFARGYLRAYAREVQLDPEDIVERYRAEFEPTVEELPAEESAASTIDWRAALEDTRIRRVAGLATVLMIGATYFAVAGSMTSSPDVESAATDAIESAAAAPVPTATTGRVDAAAPRQGSAVEGRQSSGQSGPLMLAIQTTGDCWVGGTIDGKSAIGRLMKAGDREQFEVFERAALRIGDPSAFTFTLNGKPGRVLGTAHTAVNLTFDRQNFESVLREKPL